MNKYKISCPCGLSTSILWPVDEWGYDWFKGYLVCPHCGNHIEFEVPIDQGD